MSAAPTSARALARRLIDSFGQPFVLNGEEFHTSASIGITLFPADGQAADRLLKNAELAMYRAKSNGRNGSCFFAPQMNLVARRTGLLERELRQGFAADQFTGPLPAAARSARAARSSASRRCCAGATRAAAWSARASSSGSPRTSG